jgi:hypothetical protein
MGLFGSEIRIGSALEVPAKSLAPQSSGSAVVAESPDGLPDFR